MRHIYGPLLLVAVGVAVSACKSSLTDAGRSVTPISVVPGACEEVGTVVGQGGGTINDPYFSHKKLQDHARRDARNKAAKLGATHILLGEPEVGSDEGVTRSFVVSGTAYRCPVKAEVEEIVPEEPEPEEPAQPRFRGPGTYQ